MNRGGKRKRGDAYDGHDGPSRPSPHRPDELDTARRDNNAGRMQNISPRSHNNQGQGARGGRRNARGGRNQTSRSGPSSPTVAPNSVGLHESLESRISTSQDQAISQQPPSTNNSSPRTSKPSQPESEPPDPVKEAPLLSIPSQPAPLDPNLAPRGPPPFYYSTMTDEVLEDWESNGIRAIHDTASQAHASSNNAAIAMLYLEVIRSGLDERISMSQAAEAVRSIIDAASSDLKITASELFLDTVSTLPEDDSTHPRLKALILSTDVDAQLMRHTLEEPMLHFLGLVRSTFQKIFVRKQTHALYRQANYNLLREETEGYAKLITELFTVSQNENPLTGQVVEATHQNVKALIGAFDLDAGRVLDVTLDLFATMLIKNGRFFVKFLRHSSYWPQQSSPPAIVSEDAQTFGSLPRWAEPDSLSISTSEDGKERISRLKKQRDEKFWDQARNIGIDAFFGLGQRKVLDKEHIVEQIRQAEAALGGPDNSAAVRTLETKKWIQETSTLPPQGNAVAAQLLGFKLRFYQSPARGKADMLPPNMVYLTALLVKIGFISLRDLYPHLHPSDDDMSAVREKQMKQKEEQDQLKRPGNSAMNALAKAGALGDDPAPVPTIDRLRAPEPRESTPSRSQADAGSSTPAKVENFEDASDPLPQPIEQKVALLESLLLIGAIPESLYMLGKFPWVMDAFPTVPSHIHRILHHSLAFVYDQVSPIQTKTPLEQRAQVMAANQNGVPKGDVRLVDQPTPMKKKWAKAENTWYKYYWEEWADNVPVCRTIDDVFTLCDTFLNLLGPKLGQDPSLFMKLARIGKHSLATDKSSVNQNRWEIVLRRTLCPSLSLIPHPNPGVFNAVFDILKTYPSWTRYNIYAEWFTGQTSRLPDLSTSFNSTRAETRDILRRISKTNTREMARNLAKASCASPGIVFEVCLKQIESYDNIIDTVVECGRYFTDLAYDVLTWSIISCLGREGRSRVSQTGFTANKWLQAQSTFTGRIYKRYNRMNSLPMLQYIFDQIRQNNSTDLRILSDLISNMTGVVADTNFTDAQVLAMSGGKILQSLTLRLIGDKRHDSKITAKRLIRALVDNNLAGPLLILIAQHRQTCVFNHDQDENKILSETFDEVTDVLMQYLDMLISYHSPEEFENLVPDVVSLISDYGLEPSLAFTVHRQAIRHAIASYDAKHKLNRRSATLSDTEKPSLGDVEMKDSMQVTNASDKSPESKSEDVPSSETAVGAATEPEADDVPQAHDKPDIIAGTAESSAWHPALEDIATRLREVLPEGCEQGLSIHFLVTFWQLDLSDIVAPSLSYQQEFDRQTAKAAGIVADKSDMSPIAIKRRKQEEKDILKIKAELTEEMRAHIRDYQVVRNRLGKEKNYWFRNAQTQSRKLTHALFQECFLPRILLSPLDSQFAQRMLFYLHSNGAPGFRTLELIGKIFAQNTLTNLIFHCTSREADCLGRFLFEVLKVMSEWHAERAVFEKRAHGPKKDLPGFALRVDDEGAPRIFQDYEAFRNMLFVWHRNLWFAIRDCFESHEFMHVRNAITILSRISKVYPAIEWIGDKMLAAIDALAKREFVDHKNPSSTPLARADLFNAASSVKAGVYKRKQDWVKTAAFYTPKATVKPQNVNTRAQITANAPPQGGDAATANVNGVKGDLPTKVPSSNVEPPLSAARSEMEEGEFRDVAAVVEAPPVAPPLPIESKEDAAPDKVLVPAKKAEATLPDLATETTSNQAKAHTKPESGPITGNDKRPDTATSVPPKVSAIPATDLASKMKGQPHGADARSGVPSEVPARHSNAGPATSRSQTLDQAPNGPRNARPRPNNYNVEPSRPHDNMGPPPAPRAPLDRAADKPYQDQSRPPRHQDMSYGRLNAEPDPFQSPPSQAPTRGSRPANSSPSFQDRGFNTGPVSQHVRSDRANGRPTVSTDRSGRHLDQRHSRIASTPSTPTAEPPMSPDGVHPSRLRIISGEGAPRPTPQPIATTLPGNQRLPHPNQNYPPSPNVTPMGPRSDQGHAGEYANNHAPASQVPLSNVREPPTGPSLPQAGSSLNRNDGRRQFAGLNDTLRQGGLPPAFNNNNNGNNNGSNGGQRPGTLSSAGPPRPPSGSMDRPRSHHDSRGPSFQTQEQQRNGAPPRGRLPTVAPAMNLQRQNVADAVSVHPGRAALIAGNNIPAGQRQPYLRDEQQNYRSQQPPSVNMPHSNFQGPSSGPSNQGATIRGRASVPDISNRPSLPMAGVPPMNGSFPSRPPASNGTMHPDRSHDGTATVAAPRDFRDTHRVQREDDTQQRDDRGRGREERGSERLADDSRHRQPSREGSRDHRMESDRDRIQRQREKEIGSRPLRSENQDTVRRGGDERDRNPRAVKELLAPPPTEYRENDRRDRNRSRDERGGADREDLMGSRATRSGGPPQRAAASSGDYGASGPYNKDRRSELQDDDRGGSRGNSRGREGRGDGRGEGRRGDHARDRAHGGGSERMKRGWVGDEASRDSKRPRRGNQ